MEIIAYKMTYKNAQTPQSDIVCIPFEEQFFQEYMRIYNECFYEMRKALDIQPYTFLNAYEQIADKIQDIYLLTEQGEIIGSVACYGNEIDDLIVNPIFQHKGYGKQLLLWAMQHVRERSNDPITLHVAEWNHDALMLYKQVGFEVATQIRVAR